MQFDLFEIDAHPVYVIVFVLLAVVGKMIGSGLGAKLTNFDMTRSFRVGVGMIPRGEVALIIANMALAKGIISTNIISATILMVIISAIGTPLLLKFGFTKLKRKTF